MKIFTQGLPQFSIKQYSDYNNVKIKRYKNAHKQTFFNLTI